MKFMCAFAFLLVCFVPVSMAQTTEELRADMAVTMSKQATSATVDLARELSIARKAGDTYRVRELESALGFSSSAALVQAHGQILPVDGSDLLTKTSGPMWGNDVKIFSGPMYSLGKRQLATDADTSGGIYVGLNAVYQDSLSALRVYKSTDGGRNWTYISGFRSAGFPIQSFDMCVTDTAGGKWLLGFAFVVKTDKSTSGGGTLYWGSMLSDGSSWRYTIIGSASSATEYRNPSICTDGTYYSPSVTYHYVVSEYITPSTDISRGLSVTKSTNWGKNWATADTTIRGFQEGTPIISINWSTNPDSLCLAFTRFASPSREIRMARNKLDFAGAAWGITYPVASTDNFDPSMALDPVRRTGLITFTRQTTSSNKDVMYFYSKDLFKTFTLDSIATSSNDEELPSVSYAPWLSGYYWRVAYRSSAGNDTIYYKAILNTETGFYSSHAYVMSQFRPSTLIAPVVGFDRDIGGTNYRGNCIYVGYGPTDVYYDAVDLALDVPKGSELPDQFALYQNYPNPFNPKTGVRFQVPGVREAGTGGQGSGVSVKLAVYDILGREVAVLVNERKAPGIYDVSFDGSGLSSGVYIYRLSAGSFSESRKMILMK